MTIPTWDAQLETEQAKFNSQLADYKALISTNPMLKEISNKVLNSAARASLNAAYAGSMGDGGASSNIRELKLFLDGFKYANGGSAGPMFQSIIDTINKEKDADYAKYLELKEKFES